MVKYDSYHLNGFKRLSNHMLFYIRSNDCSERGEKRHTRTTEKHEIFQENEQLTIWVPDKLSIWFTDYT